MATPSDFFIASILAIAPYFITVLRYQNAKLRVNYLYRLYEFIKTEKMINFYRRFDRDGVNMTKIIVDISLKYNKNIFQELINS